MRFVRYFTRRDTGEIVAVAEQETPFSESGGFFRASVEIDAHDLGLVEDFNPVSLRGEPCLPSAHIFERIERDGQGTRAKAGHELPPVIDCPTSLAGIKQRLRERGVEGIPAKARAWLTLMLPPEQADELGVGRGISVAVLKSLDAMRRRRDPSVGSRAILLERAAQARSDEVAAAHLRTRKKTSG